MNEYERLSTYDTLTRFYNRRKMYEFLSDEIDRFEFEARPFSILLCNVDEFRAVNVACGHETGDKVLVAVSRILFRGIRESDHLGRMGGDEFMVLLTDIRLKEAIALGDNLRRRVMASAVVSSEGERRITLSIGAVEFSEGCDFASVLKHANQALRFAKKMGKNQVRGIFVS